MVLDGDNDNNKKDRMSAIPPTDDVMEEEEEGPGSQGEWTDSMPDNGVTRGRFSDAHTTGPYFQPSPSHHEEGYWTHATKDYYDEEDNSMTHYHTHHFSRDPPPRPTSPQNTVHGYDPLERATRSQKRKASKEQHEKGAEILRRLRSEIDNLIQEQHEPDATNGFCRSSLRSFAENQLEWAHFLSSQRRDPTGHRQYLDISQVNDPRHAPGDVASIVGSYRDCTLLEMAPFNLRIWKVQYNPNESTPAGGRPQCAYIPENHLDVYWLGESGGVPWGGGAVGSQQAYGPR